MKNLKIYKKLKFQIEKLINEINNSIINLNKKTTNEKLQIRNITKILMKKKDVIR